MRKEYSDKYTKFLLSALTIEGEFCSCKDALKWIDERRKNIGVEISAIKLSQMRDWGYDKESGVIRHHAGKFFSINGIQVQTTVGEIREWRQPIINQPEIGYLGCIVKEFNGVLYFLVQAKIEPGNINVVQIAPTLQATRSNYTQQHKGRAPKYLEYFSDGSKAVVLLDQLQSEQGARFLNKRNRNIIIQTQEEIQVDEDFRWLTLGQIKLLSERDNIINMDLRTVISGIPFDGYSPETLALWENFYCITDAFKFGMLLSTIESKRYLTSNEEIISWLTQLKAKNELIVSKVPIEDLQDWYLTDYKLHHKDNLYFDVEWVSVSIENREVSEWDQPIIRPCQDGLIAFIVKKIDGIYYFLVQAKVEAGNFDIFEFAPTVQCITGSYKDSLDKIPFLKYVLHAKDTQIRFRTLQSEEGGRFYHEQNLNLIVEADEDFQINCPLNYRWMTLNQMLSFIKFNNYLNIQARSLLACIQYI
jgi:oxidase EvaA